MRLSSSPPPCPPPSAFSALVNGGLSADDAAALHAHVEGCPSCKEHLKNARGSEDETGEVSAAPVAVEGPALARGTAVGRYLVLDRVGAGGMGVVFSAYDPELDRRVALKLLQAGDGARGAEGLRLLREAQALAQLAHPNVISVYDVGTVGDRVFMAMELVDGQSLRSWLKERPHGWQEVLALFRQVAAGVAAAHARDLVHRDLKPDNVLVGKDGRVRVLDFGLARLASAPAEAAPSLEAFDTLEPTSSSGRALRQTLTRAGAVVGTPPYMPPEALKGATPDAQADQFSFCVALHESLFGERPFPSVGFLDPQRWHLREPPRGSRVPAWLRRVVLRGLSLDPAQRFPSMEALATALAADPAVRVRRLWLGGAASVVLASLAYAAVRVPSAPRMCQGATARLTGVWDPAVSGKLSAAFLATKSPIAQENFARVQQAVDAYTRQWVRMHTDACEATRVRGEQSDEVLSLRMGCLDQRLKEVKALTEVLQENTATVMAQAPRAVRALTPLDDCANLTALRAPVPPPKGAEAKARVEALRARLPRVKALLDSGRYAEGLSTAEPLVSEASAVAYRPLEAEALELFGLLQQRAGKLKEAARTYRSALNAAMAGGHRRLAAWLGARLAHDFVQLYQYEETDAWGAYAQGTLEALGGDPLIESYVEMALGAGQLSAGQPALAEPRFRRALALRSQVLGPDHPDVAAAYNNLGAAAARLDRAQDSLENFSRATDIWSRALGPDHPETLQARMNFAIELLEVGEVARAKAENDRAREGIERTLGPTHTRLAIVWSHTAKIAATQRNPAAALEAMKRVLLINEQNLGKEHHVVVDNLQFLAQLQLEQGLPSEALETLERARRIPSSPRLQCLTLRQSAAALRALGRTREAERAFDRCLSLAEASVAEHPLVLVNTLAARAERELQSGEPGRAWPLLRRAEALVDGAKGALRSLPLLNALARAHMKEGRLAEARAALERVVGAQDATLDEDRYPNAEARILLAKVLAEQQGDSARVRALAQQAIARFNGTLNISQSAEAARWLADYDAKTR